MLIYQQHSAYALLLTAIYSLSTIDGDLLMIMYYQPHINSMLLISTYRWQYIDRQSTDGHLLMFIN